MPSDHEQGVERSNPSADCTVRGSEARTVSQTGGRGGNAVSNSGTEVLRRGGSFIARIRRCRTIIQNKKKHATHIASKCVPININGAVSAEFTAEIYARPAPVQI
jgi:hypothetical protein